MSPLKLLAALLSLAPAIEALIPSPPPGFTLTWADDFVGPARSLPNPANWLMTTGTQYPGGAPNFGTGEIQTYTSSPENVALSGNGSLAITPLRNGTAWTSARIETRRTDFMAQEGGKMRIEGSIALPDVTGDAALGYWPAFWTLGDAFRGVFTNWPIVGEFDILENVNGLNRAWGTLHCDVLPGGKCNEPTGISANTSCGLGTTCQGNFHTYAIVVDRSATPEKMTWEVDGKTHHIVEEPQLGAEIWAQTVHHGHFILLNLAIGGGFPNSVQGSPTPVEATVPGVPLRVEYVAVYNSAYPVSGYEQEYR
ncbi:beta-glucanase [Marssonina coronariae]|uniref:Beta-glucanase n=1 Tax=Diplocarpon coronariae TaxID=2795749 RepID=A0A218ZEA2_9HELO|nr:beta-glucanase [Marssonina coronariae]